MEYDIVRSRNIIHYFKRGTYILHREDGPAKEWWDGCKEWWINGKRHRTDGPAYIGEQNYKEWWINGKRFSLEKEKLLNKWLDNKNGI